MLGCKFLLKGSQFSTNEFISQTFDYKFILSTATILHYNAFSFEQINCFVDWRTWPRSHAGIDPMQKRKRKKSVLFFLVSVFGLGMARFSLLLIKLKLRNQGQHLLQCLWIETFACTVTRTYDFAVFQHLKDTNWLLSRKRWETSW